MASGARSIKLLELSIKLPTSGNVVANLNWEYRVEDSVGTVSPVTGGSISMDLGSSAAALALTLGQIRTNALAALSSDSRVPIRDTVS